MIFYKTKSKINQDSLIFMINHNIVWLDISVDNTRDPVAIIQSFEHINEEKSREVSWQSLTYYIFHSTLCSRLLILLIILQVYLFKLISQTSFGIVVCNQVNLITLWVIYNLVQPYNVRMTKSLQNFYFFFYKIIGVLCFAYFLLH